MRLLETPNSLFIDFFLLIICVDLLISITLVIIEADCSQSSIFSYYPTALRMAKFDKNLSAGSMSVE